jgi:hypothetical protein
MSVRPTPSAAAIGEATMLSDRTILLDLVAGSATRGHARQSYSPSHPEYQRILQHLGGLRPGEHKAAPPWPDTIDDRRVAESVQAYLGRTRGWTGETYRLEIVGTDSSGQIAVTVDPVDRQRVPHPGGGQSVALRLDAKTYAVEKELRMK